MKFDDYIYYLKEQYKECSVIKNIRRHLDSYMDVVIYGAGETGLSVLSVCSSNNINVKYVCDTYQAGKYFGVNNKYCVISPEKLIMDYNNEYIIICSVSGNEAIFESLINMGFSCDNIIPCPVKYVSFRGLPKIESYLTEYKRSFDLFDDNISKQTFLDRLSLLALDKSMTINSESEIYYDNNIIKLNSDEVFVDCGAFNGDSVRSFLKHCNEKYKHIYAFEPDSVAFDEAKERLKCCKNIDVINKGVWDSEAILNFSSNAVHASSKISNTGNTKVELISLDLFFERHPDAELPTLIKMDIEGAECKALEGAQGIIKNQKPKLAVCVYHKYSDLYEIPQTILNIRNDYMFYLRQYENGEFDTVLYAI